jgi:nitroreductase
MPLSCANCWALQARVPDHGKLAPWRFVVLEGDARGRLGAIAAAALGDESVAADYERAPCVVAVLACPVAHPKIPRSEMILSAGAACMNLLTAAQAAGFAAQWLTGAAAYEDAVLRALGGNVGGTDGDEIAGFHLYGHSAAKRRANARALSLMRLFSSA